MKSYLVLGDVAADVEVPNERTLIVHHNNRVSSFSVEHIFNAYGSSTATNSMFVAEVINPLLLSAVAGERACLMLHCAPSCCECLLPPPEAPSPSFLDGNDRVNILSSIRGVMSALQKLVLLQGTSSSSIAATMGAIPSEALPNRKWTLSVFECTDVEGVQRSTVGNSQGGCLFYDCIAGNAVSSLDNLNVMEISLRNGGNEGQEWEAVVDLLRNRLAHQQHLFQQHPAQTSVSCTSVMCVHLRSRTSGGSILLLEGGCDPETLLVLSAVLRASQSRNSAGMPNTPFCRFLSSYLSSNDYARRPAGPLALVSAVGFSECPADSLRLVRHVCSVTKSTKSAGSPTADTNNPGKGQFHHVRRRDSSATSASEATTLPNSMLGSSPAEVFKGDDLFERCSALLRNDFTQDTTSEHSRQKVAIHPKALSYEDEDRSVLEGRSPSWVSQSAKEVSKWSPMPTARPASVPSIETNNHAPASPRYLIRENERLANDRAAMKDREFKLLRELQQKKDENEELVRTIGLLQADKAEAQRLVDLLEREVRRLTDARDEYKAKYDDEVTSAAAMKDVCVESKKEVLALRIALERLGTKTESVAMSNSSLVGEAVELSEQLNFLKEELERERKEKIVALKKAKDLERKETHRLREHTLARAGGSSVRSASSASALSYADKAGRKKKVSKATESNSAYESDTDTLAAASVTSLREKVSRLNKECERLQSDKDKLQSLLVSTVGNGSDAKPGSHEETGAASYPASLHGTTSRSVIIECANRILRYRIALLEKTFNLGGSSAQGSSAAEVAMKGAIARLRSTLTELQQIPPYSLHEMEGTCCSGVNAPLQPLFAAIQWESHHLSNTLSLVRTLSEVTAVLQEG